MTQSSYQQHIVSYQRHIAVVNDTASCQQYRRKVHKINVKVMHYPKDTSAMQEFSFLMCVNKLSSGCLLLAWHYNLHCHDSYNILHNHDISYNNYNNYAHYHYNNFNYNFRNV